MKNTPINIPGILALIFRLKRERRMAMIPAGQLIKTNPELFTPVRKKRR